MILRPQPPIGRRRFLSILGGAAAAGGASTLASPLLFRPLFAGPADSTAAAPPLGEWPGGFPLDSAVASQVLACLRELPIDPDRLNVNGGAIALGHPIGCTGAKLSTSLIYEMQRRNARYGLVTMCVGGGMGAAGIFERMQ